METTVKSKDYTHHMIEGNDAAEFVLARNIYKFMKQEFLKRVKKDIRSGEDQYWWKWLSTTDIATGVNTSPAQTRKILNIMMNRGVIDMGKSSNVCLWVIRHIEGFKQHQFKDYYTKS